jgi:hypothetical protein
VLPGLAGLPLVRVGRTGPLRIPVPAECLTRARPISRADGSVARRSPPAGVAWSRSIWSPSYARWRSPSAGWLSRSGARFRDIGRARLPLAPCRSGRQARRGLTRRFHLRVVRLMSARRTPDVSSDPGRGVGGELHDVVQPSNRERDQPCGELLDCRPVGQPERADCRARLPKPWSYSKTATRRCAADCGKPLRRVSIISAPCCRRSGPG